MQAVLNRVLNNVGPDLERRLRIATNAKPIMEAIGVTLVSLTKRSFNDASLRPSSWAPKKDGSAATLRRSGTLAKSPRVIVATNSSVTTGSDRKYAAIHQLGGRTRPHVIRPRFGKALKIPGIGFVTKVNHPGSKIPARPFFPFTPGGVLTPRAARNVVSVLKAKLGSY